MTLTNSLREKFKSWFSQRMPVGDFIILNHRSTYVLPTKSGFLLAGILLLMMIGATNYQNNLAFLLTFLLAGIALVCIVFTVRNIQGICLSLGGSQEFFAGQPTVLSIRLESQSKQPHFSIAVGEYKNALFLCDVKANQQTQIKLPIDSFKRGYQTIPRLMITSQFPLGWFKTWAYFRFIQELLIYPEPIEPPANADQAGLETENELGEKVKGINDLHGLKDYQPGEGLSRVDWKAYARGVGLLTRDFASSQQKQLCFSWRDYPGEKIEVILSYLTYQVLMAAENNISYSLLLSDQSIPFSNGEQHRLNCLKALALSGKISNDQND